MKISLAGIELICEFEGFGLPGKPGVAYQDSVGVWTIGYGHTGAAGAPKPVAGLKVTKSEGREILARDLGKFEAEVLKRIARTPTQNQFDAMVSFCFNVGPINFGKSSVLKFFNAGHIADAAHAFSLWNKAGGKVLTGLVKRRAKEAAMFLDDHSDPATSARLPDTPVPPAPQPVGPMPAPADVQPPVADVGLWERLAAWWRG